MRTFFFMLRPSVATTRPSATAASAICWMRWRWLAKLAVMMRWPRCSANRRAQHRADTGLRRRVTVFFGVGRVGQQQADAFVGRDRADAGQVGATAVDRREVELEVAGVQDHALRCVDGDRVRVRHRVGDRDELDVERTDHATLAVA